MELKRNAFLNTESGQPVVFPVSKDYGRVGTGLDEVVIKRKVY